MWGLPVWKLIEGSWNACDILTDQDSARKRLKIMKRSRKNNCKSTGSNFWVLNVLTFQWKYIKLKQIEWDRRSWNAWDIFTGLDPRLSHLLKWLLRQRKPRQTLLSTFFQKDNELKTLNVFFESAFEDLSFHSFLKASDWDFEGKNGCNKHRIWFIEHNFDCSLRP